MIKDATADWHRKGGWSRFVPGSLTITTHRLMYIPSDFPRRRNPELTLLRTNVAAIARDETPERWPFIAWYNEKMELALFKVEMRDGSIHRFRARSPLADEVLQKLRDCGWP